MNREFLKVAALAFLGVNAACAKGGGTDTAMVGTDAAVRSIGSAVLASPPGRFVGADSGMGSGGHLSADSAGLGTGGHLKACRYDATTGTLVCLFAVADSGMGSGGHYPTRVALVMGCSFDDPAKQLSCTAPVGVR